MEFDDIPELSVEFFHNPDKDEKFFITINSFRGVEYFHLRKYYKDFEGDFVPSNEGVAFPATLESTLSIFDALCSILESEEVLSTILDKSNNETIINLISKGKNE